MADLHDELHEEWRAFKLTDWTSNGRALFRFWTMDGVIVHQAATIRESGDKPFWQVFRPDGATLRQGPSTSDVDAKRAVTATLLTFISKINAPRPKHRRNRKGATTTNYLGILVLMWAIVFFLGDKACG